MKIRIEDLDEVTSEPIKLFYDGIKSNETREKYTRTLRRILCDILEDLLHGSFEQRAAELVRKAKENPEYALSILLAISRKLKQRTELPETNQNYLNPISIPSYFKPIKKIFDMNGVAVVWKRVYATFPQYTNKTKGRGYSREEIAKALNFTNGSIDKAIILVACSSGIREGGFKLKWEDLKPVYKLDGKLVFDFTESEKERAEIVCAMISIYSGDEEEYPAFITPEAYKAIEDYRSSWIKDVGREPKPTEPIFKQAGDLPLMLKPTAIKARVERVLKEAGIRIPLQKGKRRHDIPAMNGFRRFFNKANKETLSKDSPLAALIKKEYQMGHVGLIKLDRSYFQSHVFELVEEYVNAVPNLTISDEERIKAENVRLKKEKSELEKKNLEIEQLKLEQTKILEDLRKVKKRQERSEKYLLKHEPLEFHD
ncbi:MAG: integrase [Nitrosopumilaceae archaeon]